MNVSVRMNFLNQLPEFDIFMLQSTSRSANGSSCQEYIVQLIDGGSVSPSTFNPDHI